MSPPFHHSSSNNNTNTPAGTERKKIGSLSLLDRKRLDKTNRQKTVPSAHTSWTFSRKGMARQGKAETKLSKHRLHLMDNSIMKLGVVPIFLAVLHHLSASRDTNIGQGAVYRGQRAWRTTWTRHTYLSGRHVQICPTSLLRSFRVLAVYHPLLDCGFLLRFQLQRRICCPVILCE